jgi:hypothetical protein
MIASQKDTSKGQYVVQVSQIYKVQTGSNWFGPSIKKVRRPEPGPEPPTYRPNLNLD